MVVGASYPNVTPEIFVAELGDGASTSNRYLLYKNPSSTAISGFNSFSGGAAAPGSALVAGVAFRASMTYGRGLSQVSIGSGAGSVPYQPGKTLSQLQFGNGGGAGSNQSVVHIRDFAYYPEAIPAALLPNYTT